MVTALNSASITTPSIAQKKRLWLRSGNATTVTSRRNETKNILPWKWRQSVHHLRPFDPRHTRTCHLSQLGRRIRKGCPRLARPKHISADGRFQTRHIHFRKTEDLSYRNPRQSDDKLSAPKSSLELTTAGWRKVNGLCWPTRKHHLSI